MSLDAAWTVLPRWMAWTPVLYFTATAALGSNIALRLGMRCARAPAPKDRNEPWYERARRTWPARQVSRMGLFLMWVWASAPLVVVGPLSRVPPWGVAAFAVAGAAIGTAAAQRRQAGEVLARHLSWAEWLRGLALLLLLFRSGVVVAAVAAVAMPDALNAQAVVVLLLAAAVLLALVFGAWRPAARALGLVREPTERLLRVVESASTRVGVRPRSVLVLRTPMANAFAFPAIGGLGVTDTALAAMDDAELETIIAHELGHLDEGPRITMVRISGLLPLLALATVRPVVGSFGWEAYGLVVLGAFVLMLAARRFYHRMEIRADAYGSRFEGDPGTYARALERIYEANQVPAVVPGRRPSHPHLYDRLVAAGVTPSYPRPRPPSRLRTLAGELIGLLAFGFLAVAVATVPMLVSTSAPRSEGAQQFMLATLGGNGSTLRLLAAIRAGRDDFDGASALVEAAEAADALHNRRALRRAASHRQPQPEPPPFRPDRQGG